MGRRAMMFAVCVALAALSFAAIPAHKALAANTVSSAVYQDTNNDGAVDTIVVTMDENVTACVYEAGDWSVSVAGTIGVTGVTGISCTGTDPILNISVTSGANKTGGVTNPTIAYANQGTLGSVTLTSGAMTAKSIIPTDAAKPIVVSATINKTASRNNFTLVYSEPVTTTDGASSTTNGDLTTAGTLAGFGSFATPGNATVPTTKNTMSGNGTATIVVTFADQAAGYFNNGSSTGPSGVFTPVAAAAVVDAVALQVNTAHTVTTTVTGAWTLTQPTITSVTLSDANFNGSVDTATVVLSAAMRDANVTNGDALLGGAGHTGTFTTGTANDATTVFALTTDNLPANTSATAAQFTYSGATTRITDLFGNLLATATPGTIVAADVVEADNAPPVIISTSPASASTSIMLRSSILVDFSESMNFSGCTFSASPDTTGYGSITTAGNWSAGMTGLPNSTVVITNSIAQALNTAVTITIGGCTAAVGGAALHANAAFPNPWTFTTTASTASGSNRNGGAAATPTPASVTLSIPDGGATYNAGQEIGINWAAANGPFGSFRVSYSSDNGNNWTVLANAVPGTSSSLSWVVPTASTTQGLIKVEGLNSTGTVLASDTSASTFTINGTTVAPPVVAPPVVTPPVTPSKDDSTVAGNYDVSTAKGNNPDFNTDMGIPTATTAAACVSGSLIKGKTMPAVYYCGADGKRYVFVNDKAFFSWYTDFKTVKTIPDATLSSIMIGGNITYRPGTRMIKIQSDPKVYVVARGGVLRWVATEAAAVRLFGANWNKMIDDVSDSFFTNYKVGASITQ